MFLDYAVSSLNRHVGFHLWLRPSMSPATPLRCNSLHLIDHQIGDLYIVLSPLLKIDYALAACIHRLLGHSNSHPQTPFKGLGPISCPSQNHLIISNRSCERLEMGPMPKSWKLGLGSSPA